MKLDCVRQLWGVQEPLSDRLREFKALGYVAVETAAPPKERLAHFKQQLKDAELGLVAMIYTAGATVQEHLRYLEQEIERVKGLSPLFINAHSGRDAWSEDEAKSFFEGALKLEASAGLVIAHETHRGRILFNPWVTRNVLHTFPELKLTCDYSHWVCVTERLLTTETEILELCARHAHHIHARVGHEHGPQVADPRAPEYLRYVEAHERFWDMIWDAQAKRGYSRTTLTPEFGPPGYMPTLPFTRTPVTDLSAISEWMTERQRARFNQRSQRA
ncbi:MAG: TIM barrel protein [Polyangiaceae bacterium]|nr:TIM barrel protein [Polyangiaceae bacterium]